MAGGGKQCELVVVVAGLLLLAAASPVAYGQFTLPMRAGNVTGVMCCTPSGNCAPGAVGIPNVTVSLNCTTASGRVVTVAQSVTNATGGFSLSVNNVSVTLRPSLNGLVPCNVIVPLPLNNITCSALSTVNGTLSSAISLVGTTVGGLLGGIFRLLGFTFNAA